MANPKDGLTTVNVKNVSEAEWERAKRCANRSDEVIGTWLSRAVKLLADMEESGGREFGPGEPTKPRRELSPEQVAALLQGVGATQSSRNRAAVELRTLAAGMAREALGMDPLPVRSRPVKPANQIANLTHQNGQTPLIEGGN